jgi:hypothetical protein
MGESNKAVNWKPRCLETWASILPKSAGALTRAVCTTAHENPVKCNNELPDEIMAFKIWSEGLRSL